jgi:hypothetical protein
MSSTLMVKNKATVTFGTERNINGKNQVNKKFILVLKQAKTNHLDPNERFCCQKV